MPLMMQARERKLPLICANPDIVVQSGDRLLYCAGAIAELYRELGGEVVFYGKPHRPIYERAMALGVESSAGKDSAVKPGAGHWRSLDAPTSWARMPSASTCLFLTRGIHSEEFAGIDQLDPVSVKELFGRPPLALMRELRW